MRVLISISLLSITMAGCMNSEVPPPEAGLVVPIDAVERGMPVDRKIYIQRSDVQRGMKAIHAGNVPEPIVLDPPP